MIKAILFDLDNTLIDFWKFKNKCVGDALDEMIKAGLNIEKKKASQIIIDIFREFGMEYKYIFQEFMKRAIGKVDYRILAHGMIAYRNARTSNLMAYPQVKETIMKLKKKGYKIAIISDAPKQKAWMRIVLIGIDSFIDAVVTFDDTKKRKPHSLPFQKAVEKLKVHPSEILMVGDSISKDMKGAKALGMKTALAVYGRTLKPRAKPEATDFLLHKISELIEIVRKA